MMRRGFAGVMRAISSFFIFFFVAAFFVTCCLSLFISTMQRTMGISFTEDQISAAAKVTMANVILLSVIFSVIDIIRRTLTVRLPVKRITEATEKMISGDFSVRIPMNSKYISDDSFNEIISCINKMAQELSGVETLRSDFISNVSHEMKTPLATIRNYGRLLEDESISEEDRIEYARNINEAARRLSDMVTNVLKLSRLENQQIYPEPTSYELGEQLCECLLQYESVWDSKEISLETSIDEDITVLADRELLSLVWNNLFSNAFKFTEKGGKVGVSLRFDGEYAVVSVSDTGCGMTADVGAHIFEKFYQGDTSHSSQGNGLGLALVKRVIDIMHGEISVQSEVGVGTSFTVRIRRGKDGL